MKRIILIIFLLSLCSYAFGVTPTPTITCTITPTFTVTPSKKVDVTHVTMTTKPIGVQTINNLFSEVMPVGLQSLIDGYDVVYPNAINPRLSANCTLILYVKVANITTVRTYLQNNNIDSGAVTGTAYNGLNQ